MPFDAVRGDAAGRSSASTDADLRPVGLGANSHDDEARGSGDPAASPSDQGRDRLSPAALLTRIPVGLGVAIVPPMAVAGLTQQVGLWRSPVGLASLAVGVVLGVLVARWVPAAPVGRRTAATLLLLATALGVWAGLTHGEHVVVRRDAGAYATYALSLDAYGGVPLDPGLAVFGLSATDPQARVSAAANYQVPEVDADGQPQLRVVPQFLVGTPALLSIGWWLGGWTGLFLVPAVLAAAAVAAFGALASRLVGPRAAIGATLALVASQPLLLVARQTYSEPVSLLLLLSAALLTVLAFDASNPARATRLGLLAGALVGANLFVRIDAARELVLLVPILAVLIGLHRPVGRAMALGALVATVPAALATTWWSSPYIAQVESSIRPLSLIGLGLVALAAVLVPAARLLARRWRRPPRPLTALAAAAPPVVAGAVAVAGLVLLSRPLWLVDRRVWSLSGVGDFVEALQVSQGLPPDGARTYAENTVEWLSWWLGWPLVAVAFVAAVALTYRAVARLVVGDVPGWVVPFTIGLAVTLLALWRPLITPDHPWADRRVVTIALPFVLLTGAAGLAWAVRWAGRAGAVTGSAAAGAAALVLVLPAAVATVPLGTERTELGRVAAVETLCEEIGPNGAVVAVGFRARVEWAPVIRARCRVPLVGIVQRSGAGSPGLAADAVAAARAAQQSGRDPVILAGEAATVNELGLDATQVVDLTTSEPQRVLLEPATGTRPLPVRAWLIRP